jgi:hypothetical protein
MSWTPADITTALWLDAADSTTITESSGVVSDWADKSGNGLDVTQATSAFRPTLSTFNDRGALLFGDTLFLANTSDGITSGTYTGELTVFAVVTITDSIGGTLLTERADSLVATTMWYEPTGGLDDAFLSSDGANGASNNRMTVAVFQEITSAGAILTHQHESGARDNLWIDGVSKTVTAGTASDITGSAGFRIGEREAALESLQPGWPGLVCEIVVITDALTTETRELVEGYLYDKWFVPRNRRNRRSLGLRR